ncbi:MAG: metallophosphoesterase [Bacteroidetes bacterium]|nr:metallophosphoesterase [Bacteroidota bacterium]
MNLFIIKYKITLLIISSVLLSFSYLSAQDTSKIRTIAIYGDTRSNYITHQKIINDFIPYHPQIVIHTGDEVYVGFLKKQWKTFNKITAEIRKTALYFPVPGNHEMEAKEYYDNFNLPEPKKWYFYEKDGLLLLFINTNLDFDVNSQQYAYFSKILEEKSKTASYIIAITHHPPYSTGPHKGKAAELQKTLVPLFEKYHVSAVFSGHVHAFEHSVAKSIHYVITGGGGATLHPQKYKSSISKKYYCGYHYCILNILKDKIQLNVYDDNNNLIYNFDINSRK